MRKIRKEIWELLLEKGFKESSRSGKILKKEIIITRDDITTKYKIKYIFGKINLKKFKGDFKVYSIPYKYLSLKDGKITKNRYLKK